MAKIYPQQWRQIHPFATPMSTDQYYAKLANRVAEILKRSLLNEAFETTEDLTDTAIRITADSSCTTMRSLLQTTSSRNAENMICNE